MKKKTVKPRRKPVRRGKKSAKRPKARRLPVQTLLWISGIAVLLLLLGLLAPYLFRTGQAETGAPVPEGYERLGLDLSHHQHTVVWDSLRVMTDARGRTTRSLLHARNVFRPAFVCIKATEGLTWTDRRFGEYWEEAGRCGIPRCAYHFFRSSRSAEAQARHFIQTVGPLAQGDLPPVLDVETMHRGCSKKALSDSVAVWMKAVAAHYGVRPVLYCPDSYACSLFPASLTEAWPVWVAHYGVDRPDYGKWRRWQFTERAVVYGIAGYADLSVLRPE